MLKKEAKFVHDELDVFSATSKVPPSTLWRVACFSVRHYGYLYHTEGIPGRSRPNPTCQLNYKYKGFRIFSLNTQILMRSYVEFCIIPS